MFNEPFVSKSKWEHVPIRWIPEHIYLNFPAFKYRINGVVYRRESKAFMKAYHKELMWETLQK